MFLGVLKMVVTTVLYKSFKKVKRLGSCPPLCKPILTVSLVGLVNCGDMTSGNTARERVATLQCGPTTRIYVRTYID